MATIRLVSNVGDGRIKDVMSKMGQTLTELLAENHIEELNEYSLSVDRRPFHGDPNDVLTENISHVCVTPKKVDNGASR